MIIGIPSSTNGIDLYFLSKDPDSTFQGTVFVHLILTCHLQSFDIEPLSYSHGVQFFRFILEKNGLFVHVLDSNFGFHPDNAAYALIVLYSSL